MAQAVASNELVWWRALWDDLGFDPGKMSAAPTGWCDNDGAVRLVESAARFEATKHFLPKFHSLRDRVRKGLMRVRPIPSERQLADCLTKRCDTGLFKRLASTMLGCSFPVA